MDDATEANVRAGGDGRLRRGGGERTGRAEGMLNRATGRATIPPSEKRVLGAKGRGFGVRHGGEVAGGPGPGPAHSLHGPLEAVDLVRVEVAPDDGIVRVSSVF